MVVQGGDFEAVFESRAHHGINLVLEEDDVAHHHRMVPRFREGSPGGQAHAGNQADARGLNLNVAEPDHQHELGIWVEQEFGLGKAVQEADQEASRQVHGQRSVGKPGADRLIDDARQRVASYPAGQSSDDGATPFLHKKTPTKKSVGVISPR